MYPCPCCGYLTLSEKSPGTYEICPICCWEDALIDEEPGSNGVSLRIAQRNFLAFGACDRDFLTYTRHPTKQDHRSPDWQTLDQQANTASLLTIETIIKAFSTVTRENGVSLHEARAIDDYQGAQERAAARLQDTDTQWQEIPDQWIEEYSDVLSFFDAKGFRYYIPAYMIWSIRNYQISRSLSLDFTIYALGYDQGLEHHRNHQFRLFNLEQAQAICRFLQFMTTYGEPWVDSGAARSALKHYWEKFVV